MTEENKEKESLIKLFRALLLIFILTGIALIVYGLFKTKLVCEENYTAIDGECCIDGNENGKCDDQECIDKLIFAKNSSGHCVAFNDTCLDPGWLEVESCPPTSCFDGIQNCHNDSCETGVDCGGPCTVQVIQSCLDGIMNQGEEDVDCGGPCPPCILRKPKPTCFDGTRNQNESGVDCGGPCLPCLPTCFDGVKNQNEENVDCGGPCPACVIQPSGKLVWTYNLTERINDVAASSNGSSILLACGDHHLYFLNLSGKLRWNYMTGDDARFVGLTADGLYALAGSDDNYLYSFKNASKTLPATTYSKRYQLGVIKSMDFTSAGESVVGGVAFDENLTDEDVYRADYIFKFNKNAELIKSYATKSDVRAVSISPSGNLLSGISFDKLFVNGVSIDMGWLYTFDYLEFVDASDSAVVVGNTNNVYFVSNNIVRWIYNTSRTNDVAISNRNNIIVGSDKAVMLDASMNEAWSYDIGYEAVKVAVSDSGNVVAVFFENRYLHVFDKDGNLLWKYFTGDKILSMKISPTEDYIVAGSYGGVAYLFRI